MYSFQKGCKNATINAENSNTLRIKSAEFTDYSATNILINGPQGDGTALYIYADYSKYSFNGAIINAANTTKIEMFGVSNARFKNVKLYALYSESIFIQCVGRNGHSDCEDLKIYMYSDTFDINNPYPYNRLNVKCESSPDCVGVELFMKYNNDNQWSCAFVFINSLWYCGNHLVTWNTPSPSKNPVNVPTSNTDVPTFTPTLYPTKTPTDMPTHVPSRLPSDMPSNIPTDTPSRVPSYIPTETPVRSPSVLPTVSPFVLKTQTPTLFPTIFPTTVPSLLPSNTPTTPPFLLNTQIANKSPTDLPSTAPTISTVFPTNAPSISPISLPTKNPTSTPTVNDFFPSQILPSPTNSPSLNPRQQVTPVIVKTINQTIITPSAIKIAIIIGSLIIGCFCSIMCFTVSIVILKTKSTLLDTLRQHSNSSINSNDSKLNDNIKNSLALPSRTQNIIPYDA